MKTIIAGGRDFTNGIEFSKGLDAAVSVIPEITEVVSGCAPGADKLGETWAAFNGVPIRRFPADWDTLGKSAGPIRNQQMADYADALIAFWDGQSGGTKDMIDRATAKGLKVYVHAV